MKISIKETMSSDSDTIKYIKSALSTKDEERIKELGDKVQQRIDELDKILSSNDFTEYTKDEHLKMIEEYFMLIGHIRGYTQKDIKNLPGPFRMWIDKIYQKIKSIWK